MQDKEFDRLFSAKLDNFEAEPTSQVWDGIVEGLDGKRRYKMFVPYLSIAANIIVLAAAGILLIPQKTAVTTKSPVKTGIVKTTQPAIVIAAVQQPAVVNSTAGVKHSNPVDNTGDNHSAPIVVESQSPETQQQEQPLLAAAQQKQDVINPVLPDNNTPLVTKPVIDDAPAFITKSALTASIQPTSNKQDDAASVKPKRKAHGIGGLLNAVIATVDKRKEKLIEFTDSDDDETNVMSINLRALKSKRESSK
ncbi:hypothetical protein [Mucilaginibacter sp. OK098]|uniref:hypothetical protein n=1 Tax=Mucilaginibacter sp. OK098 TaxID=1855297 RepID=UPI00091F48E2|nr:hypothetical protein [Mucilaginibacter sp. OK098]SHN37313.1 hypothetical protein SAMN05216524_11530 [Mucilaginibacter sp. OK098]